MLIAAAVLALSLTERFAALDKASGGRIGICVQAVEGGDAQDLHGAERFPMQSVYKLPIAMAVLDQVDRGTITLKQKVTLRPSDMGRGLGFHSPLRDRYPNGGVDISVRDLIRAAIVDSDGVASDVLFHLVGTARISAYLRSIAVRDLDVALTERAMASDPSRMAQYRNSATPCAAVALLTALQQGRAVSAAATALLLGDLADSVPGAKRLKGGLPPGTAVAHKTGTDSTVDGLTRATNDIGIVTLPDGRHLAIAVFVKDSRADESTRERVIADAARLAYNAWTAK